MFKSLKQSLMSPTVSQAREIIKELYDKDSRSRRWFTTPVNILISVCGDIPVNKVRREHILEWERIVDGEKERIVEGESIVIRGNKGGRRGGGRGDKRRKGKLKPYTVDHYKRSLRAFFNHLVKLGYLKESPATGLSFATLPDAEPKHLEPHEVLRLMEAGRTSIRDYAILQVLRASGVRIGGLVSMTIQNLKIDQVEVGLNELDATQAALVELAFTSNLQHVLKDEFVYRYEGEFVVVEKGKRGRKQSRYAFLDHEACTALLEYLKIRPLNAPFELWLTIDGQRPLTESGVYQLFKKAASAAGLDVSPHDLRHTFAFNLISQGIDPKTVAHLMGHRDFRTTLKIYYNPRHADLKRIYRQTGRNGYNHP